jgi:hypothetical protein
MLLLNVTTNWVGLNRTRTQALLRYTNTHYKNKLCQSNRLPSWADLYSALVQTNL